VATKRVLPGGISGDFGGVADRIILRTRRCSTTHRAVTWRGPPARNNRVSDYSPRQHAASGAKRRDPLPARACDATRCSKAATKQSSKLLVSPVSSLHYATAFALASVRGICEEELPGIPTGTRAACRRLSVDQLVQEESWRIQNFGDSVNKRIVPVKSVYIER
jgi:hypothetical protein